MAARCGAPSELQPAVTSRQSLPASVACLPFSDPPFPNLNGGPTQMGWLTFGDRGDRIYRAGLAHRTLTFGYRYALTPKKLPITSEAESEWDLLRAISEIFKVDLSLCNTMKGQLYHQNPWTLQYHTIWFFLRKDVDQDLRLANQRR